MPSGWTSRPCSPTEPEPRTDDPDERADRRWLPPPRPTRGSATAAWSPRSSGPSSRSSATTTSTGKPLVYLDSAATSQKPRAVIDAIDTYYREYNANVHRGIYEIGERSTAAYEAARASVARFINAPDAHEIVFTRNATEAINLVAYSWGRKNIERGDVIVLTEMEHHANLVPWQLLVQERDGDLEFIPITDDGVLRLDVFEVLLRLRPKLVAFTHVSNTLGTINPVAEMTRLAHEAGALVLVDGAQAVPHVPVDVRAIDADFYVFSGHKMLGADGVRRALGAPRAPRGDAPVPVRRRDDPRGPPPPVRVERDPLEVRGRHAGHRRRDRPGRGGGLPPDARDGPRPRARAGAPRVRAARRSPPRTRTSPCTGRWTRRSAAASSRSTSRASTRTTWPRSSTGRGSPSGPATTARCRSTSAWISPATARASFNVYTTRADIDALIAGIAEVKRVFGG